mmetsp:Transcript_43447/g.123898  ORF Transcript_43447/g.123898 Transcript_43447/m.123898 type:complete len:261 (-) Transcript_43447:172-954(-)
MLPEVVPLLQDLVLHVDLLRRVTGPSIAALDEALLLVGLELVAVVVLRAGVPAAEEEGHGADLEALVLLELALLHESTEWRKACAQARHEDRHGLVLGNLHHRVRGVANAEAPRPEEGQEAGAKAEFRVAALGLPVLANDEQLALAGVVVARGANRIHALLDGREELRVLLRGDADGLELRQVVGEGVRPELPILEFLHLPIQGKLCDLHLLLDVLSVREELLQELTRWLAEKVQILRQHLLHCCEGDCPFLLSRCDILR